MKRQRSARTPFPAPPESDGDRLALGRRSLLMGIPALTATGCVGSFSLLRHFSTWNLQIHESKWVNWLIFLAFVIIPVYEIIVIVDVFVINSIEFWTEEDPIDWEVRHETDDGGEAIVRRTEDPNVLEWSYAKGGETRLTLYVERDPERGSLRLLDDRRGQISRVAVSSQAELRDHRDGQARTGPKTAVGEFCVSAPAMPNARAIGVWLAMPGR